MNFSRSKQLTNDLIVHCLKSPSWSIGDLLYKDEIEEIYLFLPLTIVDKTGYLLSKRAMNLASCAAELDD